MLQTNKTILLKQINPDMGDILTYVSDVENKKSLSDEDIIRIHEELEVKSFKEFMERFTPDMYMMLNTDQKRVDFSFEHLGTGEQRIRLGETDSLFNMLTYLLDAKHHKKYTIMSFSDMMRHLIPVRDIEPILSARDEIVRLIMAGDTDKIRRRLSQFLQQYDDGLMLMWALLQDIVSYVKDNGSADSIDRAIIEDDDLMQVEILKISNRCKRKKIYIRSAQSEQYREIFSNAYNAVCNDTYVTNHLLVQYMFVIPLWISDRKKDCLYEIYNSYSIFLEELYKKFWMSAKPMIETMLGVKEFFDQYQGEDGMNPSLVVANFELNALLNEKNQERFDLYLQTVNDKNDYTNTIWYAILPNVAGEYSALVKPLRERFQGNGKEHLSFVKNEIPETILTLEILARHKIVTLMSFQISEENSFDGLHRNGADLPNQQLAPFEHISNKEYMVPCYPNFVVVPKYEACMSMGRTLEYNEFSDNFDIGDEKNIWLSDVGIEASYVAAGLIAACQCPKHLGKFFKKGIDEETPGVAYRITEADNNTKTCTNMYSDTIVSDNENYEQALLSINGILFGRRGGKVVVLTDRTFAYTSSNKYLVSMVQTSTYIERIIRYETQDFKKNLINVFFQKRPGSVMEKWKKTGRQSLNQILKEDEDINFDIDETNQECNLTIRFTEHGCVSNTVVKVL